MQLQPLLEATIHQYVAPHAHVTHWEPLNLAAQGFSGAAVARYRVTYTTPDGSTHQTSLVTKEAGLLERRAVTHLGAQKLGVPWSYTPDLETDAPFLLCQQDVTPTAHPGRAALLHSGARRLAAIHAAHLGKRSALPWLPLADASFFTDHILADWRGNWQQNLRDPVFQQEYADVIPAIEAAVPTFTRVMEDFWADHAHHTLISTDFSPVHLLFHEGDAFIIDWGGPRYGSLYLDLPNVFGPDDVRAYHTALREFGVHIPTAEFMERYRQAGHYFGIKYMSFALWSWRNGGQRRIEVTPYLRYTIQCALHGR